MANSVGLSSVILLLTTTFAFAQEGELRGKVTNKNSSQPVAGVTITMEGFSRQTVADENGEFVLLGIWPGNYTVRLGNTENAVLVVEAVGIRAFMTTRLDVQWAERAEASSHSIKLLESSDTVHRLAQEDIRNSPVRGLENLLTLQTGVIERNGELYVRGGGAGELSSFINGVNATSLLADNRAATFEVIPEAVAEIQLYSGAFGAELGHSNLAPVHTILRSGGENFHATLDYRTDDLAKPGEQFLGTSSFGYRHAVTTLGGPLGSHARYFIAAQHNYMRNRTVSFVEPFRFENLKDDGLGGRPTGEPLPDAVAYERNYLPHNWLQNNTVQGNLLFAKAAFNLRLTGAYAHDNRPLGTETFTGSLNNYFNLERSRENTSKTALFSLRATHALSAKSFYALNFSFAQQSFTNADPAFGNDWMSYADSAKVTPLGYSGWRERYIGPAPHSVILAFRLNARGAPINSFQKGRQSNLGLAGDFTTVLNTQWKIKTGLRFDRWSLRSYSVGNISNALTFLNGRDGKTPRTFPTPEERAIRLSSAGAIFYLGHDVDGNEVDSGSDGPRTPNLFSAYVQSEYQWQRLTLSLGVRYERVTSNALVLEISGDSYDDSSSELVEAKPTNHFLPRFGFTVPLLREQTFVYGGFGKYIAPFGLLGLASASDFYGVLASAKLSMQTKYELGVRHKFVEQLQASAVYFSRADDLFSNAHGLELNMSFVKNLEWQAHARYTLTNVPKENAISETLPPHRGVFVFEYRPDKNSGKILQGLGLHVVFSATSSHEYGMPSSIRSFSGKAKRPANFQIDLGLNKIFALGNVDLEFYVHALNLLNKKNVLNVYPNTGEPNDDGWLRNPLSEPYKQIPNYEAFYRAINLDNRWAYTGATGNDIYGQPRQVRVGVRLAL